jgi:hypothetical protein
MKIQSLPFVLFATFLLLACIPCLPLSINQKEIVTRRQSLGFLSGILPSILVTNHNLAHADDTRLASPRSKAPYLTSEYFQPAAISPEAGRYFFPTLTPPFQNRATYRYTLGRNAWAFEQLLTFVNVTATIRCNVLQLEKTGGLWVHSPQWPTGEFCKLLDDLERPVEHIVLPANALEHKAPMKAFVQRYPDASVWISPGQYGPFGSCGQTMEEVVKMGYRVDGILGDDGALPPWADEFDIATLYVALPQNAGPVSEVAFCHRPTKTLVATDAVVFVPDTAPDIFTTYFDQETVKNDPTFWRRSVLQAVFLPLRLDENGEYPGYDALRGKLVRAPILRAFADARAPDQVEQWISSIAKWDFDRILTSHFASPIAATPKDFAAAYGYLPKGDMQGLPPIACQDWELLDGLNKVISENKLGAPAIYDYQRGCIE